MGAPFSRGYVNYDALAADDEEDDEEVVEEVDELDDPESLELEPDFSGDDGCELEEPEPEPEPEPELESLELVVERESLR
ncbi:MULTISPECIES: hypothetical protein [unclassified Salinibacterium]|uniref:hypothetical protein n=1 Tax=unclassified Salinibacterium TaxID=2632331 RepID=UPI0027D9EA89|nr:MULTISPECIES: hypothetical protein [unclassified Salinibacterium]